MFMDTALCAELRFLRTVGMNFTIKGNHKPHTTCLSKIVYLRVGFM